MSQLVDSALSSRPSALCSSAAQQQAAILPATQQSPAFAASTDPFLPAAANAAVDSPVATTAAHHSVHSSALDSASPAVTGNAQSPGAQPADMDSGGLAIQKSVDQLGKSASSVSIGGKRVQKPAWALTADAAKDAEQQQEEELLAFAGGLEFDKYIAAQEDAELQGVLQVGHNHTHLLLIVPDLLCFWYTIILNQENLQSVFAQPLNLNNHLLTTLGLTAICLVCTVKGCVLWILCTSCACISSKKAGSTWQARRLRVSCLTGLKVSMLLQSRLY